MKEQLFNTFIETLKDEYKLGTEDESIILFTWNITKHTKYIIYINNENYMFMLGVLGMEYAIKIDLKDSEDFLDHFNEEEINGLILSCKNNKITFLARKFNN